MAIEFRDNGQPEWTAEAWSSYLADAERRRTNGLAGVPNGDGTMTLIFDKGEGLESVREHVAEVRSEVSELEQLWLR